MAIYMFETIAGITLGAEEEHHARVTGYFTPGCPERGPSYASGGEPEEPAAFEVSSIELLIGRTWEQYPLRFVTQQQMEALEQEGIQDVAEQREDARERAQEDRAERRREAAE